MKNVNQDVFASFADAQMSKEQMKMVKGGLRFVCWYGPKAEWVRGTFIEANDIADASKKCMANTSRNDFQGATGPF